VHNQSPKIKSKGVERKLLKKINQTQYAKRSLYMKSCWLKVIEKNIQWERNHLDNSKPKNSHPKKLQGIGVA